MSRITGEMDITRFKHWLKRPWVEYYYRCDCGQIIFSSKDIKRCCCLGCRKVVTNE
jgi:hypothetical protein